MLVQFKAFPHNQLVKYIYKARCGTKEPFCCLHVGHS
jgi:hypothetical protein